MKAIALFVALATAHASMVAAHDVPLSFWTPFAYLWQDAAIALLFAAFARVLPRSRILWAVYALIVGYAALNVVVARVLPGPLTPAMFRAAGGALADSILQYATLANLAACLPTVLVGVLAPMLLSRLKQPSLAWRWLQPVIACAFIVIGPVAAGQIATGGLHRNAFGALLPVRLPRSALSAAIADLRTSPFDAVKSMDLAHLRGAARGRNVVVVVLESVGAHYLKPYGAASDPMPNLNRLAQQGLLFDAAYAVYPESIKGLFSVLCARYPAFDVSIESIAAAGCDSLAARLAANGYRTGLFHSGRFAYLGMQALLDGKGFTTLADAATLTGRVDSSFGIDEPTTVKAMLAWLDAAKSSAPFFLMYLPAAGHHPYATLEPGPFVPVDDRNRYLNAIHEADAALGQLLAGIAERGLSNNTLFVVFGDHAEAFGQHPGNIGHSFYLYEENVRVPFVIAAPGLWQNTTRIARPLSLVDTAPTILDLTGSGSERSANSRHVDGQSALTSSSDLVYFFTDYAQRWLGLYDNCWKYHYEVGSRRPALYDICTDPGETHDLAAREPARAAAYEARVLAWAGATRASLSSDRQ